MIVGVADFVMLAVPIFGVFGRRAIEDLADLGDAR